MKGQNWPLSDAENIVKISQYFLNIAISRYFQMMQYIAFAIYRDTKRSSLPSTLSLSRSITLGGASGIPAQTAKIDLKLCKKVAFMHFDRFQKNTVIPEESLSHPLPAIGRRQSHPRFAQSRAFEHQHPPRTGLCCPPEWFLC